MRNLLRAAAVVAAAAVTTATTTTTTLAVPAHAGPADRGGEWLEGELSQDGLVRDSYPTDNGPVTYIDHGLTVDFGLAFAELDQQSALAAVRDGLADEVDSYTTGVDFGAPDDVYAGATAKLATLVQVSGGDPRAYGGVDLVQRLSRRVADSPRRLDGRISDKSKPDYANTIGQAFAARALARAGFRKADEAVRFLLDQQCSRGSFRLDFSRRKKVDQSCDAASAKNSAADTDVTALAVLSLRALPRSERTRATRRAVDNATDWLVGAQKRNGSLGGGTSTEASNANSTGLAAWALGEVGACRSARRAAGWVRNLQVPADAAGPLAGEDGAIAYDRSAYRAAGDDGITEEADDQWRRTTAQAAPGLAAAAGC